MEIRWLGEVEPTFNPSFYPSLVRISMARRFHHDIAQSGWATVKLGIDLGEVFSKAPELANYFCKGRGPGYYSATSTLSPSHAQSEEANSLARRLPSRIRSVATFKLRCSIYRGRI